jgi:hypothetical protein
LEHLQVEQVLVAGDDQIDLSGKRQGEDVIIIGVAADRSLQVRRGDDFRESV